MSEQQQDPMWVITQVQDPDVEFRRAAALAMQQDDRLVKCIRAMDDTALERFAFYHDLEREEWITEVTNYLEMPSELAKITRRLEIEAKAIARVRWMQADALLAAEHVKQEAQR